MFKAGVNTTLWQWIGQAIQGFIDLTGAIFTKPLYMNLLGLFMALMVFMFVVRLIKQRG